jgi:cold shock CspA family protein
MSKKQGVVRCFYNDKGWGVIRVGDESSLERYFLHFSNIRSGTATPPAGSDCFFEVDEKSVGIEGRLPKAIRVDIILPEVVDGGAK